MSETISQGWLALLRSLKPFGGTDLDALLAATVAQLNLKGLSVRNGKSRLAKSGSFVGEPGLTVSMDHSGTTLDAYFAPDFSEQESILLFGSLLDLALSSGDRRSGSAHTPLMAPSGSKDRVTGTIDRDSFVDFLDMELATATEVATVMMVGLDGLDTIKETIGHEAGDEVLRQTAARLQDTLRSCDIVSRVGMESFAVFCPGLLVEVAGPLAIRLQDAIGAPIDWRGSAIRTTASAGIATRSRGERTAALLEHSELALIAAKENGASEIAIYDGVIRARSEDRRELAAQLVDALAQNQLATAFDPIVKLPQGEVMGVEAHVLWNHPTRGQIDRADFMGLAELIGRVDDVERAIVEFAIAQNSGREQKVRTGFNVSASTLTDPTSIQWIIDRLSGEDHHLILEVDEEAILASPTTVGRHLAALRDVGASIVLDNFGVGPASLRALHSLPFDGVKLHSSLLYSGTNKRARSIVTGLYAIAECSGFDVIHAGVDSDDDLRRLLALCESAGIEGFYAQGKAIRRRVNQSSKAA